MEMSNPLHAPTAFPLDGWAQFVLGQLNNTELLSYCPRGGVAV